MTAAGWVTRTHADAGVAIRCPESWEVTPDWDAGVPLVAVEPDHGEGFRANVVVTVDELAAGTDLREWQRHQDEQLPEALPGYLLLDLQRVLVGGFPGVRRLAHYAAPGPEAVTMQQWATVAQGRGYTVTASAATLAYDPLADAFAAIAESVALPESTSAREV